MGLTRDDRIEGVYAAVNERDVVEAAFGALTPDERRRAETLRLADPALNTAAAALETMLAPLWATAPPVAPPPGLWDSLNAAIDRTDSALAGMREIAFDVGWNETAPGVALKPLWDATFLVRCAAGSVLPSHEHPCVEHTLVISGDLVIEGLNFGPGDYHAMPAGSHHPDLCTRTGCILLISYAA